MNFREESLDDLDNRVREYPYIACRAWGEEDFEMLPSECFLPWLGENAIFSGHGMRLFKNENENFYRVEILETLEEKLFDYSLSSYFTAFMFLLILLGLFL